MTDSLLRADIYGPGGGALIGGPILNILSAQRTRRVNAIGDWQVTIPATDYRASLFDEGREIRVTREDEGELWRGVIESVDKSIGPDGLAILVAGGRTLGAELAYANTALGLT